MQQQYHHVVDDLILIKSIGKGNFGEVFLTKKKKKTRILCNKKNGKSSC